MISQLLRFEAFYQLKQRVFPLLAGLFFFMGILAGRQGFAPANVDFNSTYQINFFTGLISLGSVFIVMFFAISGMLRDRRFNMENIIYSTSIKKWQFFWSRYLGVFVSSLLAFTPFLIGYAVSVTFSDLDPERVAEFHMLTYVRAWLLIVVPNILVCSALVFATSTLSKSNLATYVSAIFIYMLYMISSLFLNSPLMAQSVPATPEGMALAALADPFGIAAFFEQTQFWTPFQKNTQFLSFTGLYMWNRILWIALTTCVLFGTYFLFSFRQMSQKVKKAVVVIDKPEKTKEYRPIQAIVGQKSQRASFFSLLKIELSGVFKSLPFIGVISIWLVIVFMEINSTINEGGAYNDSLYPLSNLLIDLFADPLSILSFILIIFYSGELVWRERSLNFDGILDATPVANWVLFSSKLLALIMLPLLLIASGIIVALGFQISKGYYNFELGQYLSMFYYNGTQLIIFSMMALFIQSLFRNKYLGMGVTGLIILGSFLAPKVGLEHDMLRFGFLPRLSYNNMTGYSGESTLFSHLSLYWFVLASILSLISFKLWQRGVATNFRFYFIQARSNWRKWEITILALFCIVLFASGGTTYYNMNVLNDYYSSAEVLDYKEAYERKFKKYDDMDRFYHVSMKTEVDLYPKEQRYTVKANNILKNKHDHPIAMLFITEKEPMHSIQLENAKLVEHDSLFGTYLFEFNEPVKAQQEVKFKYEIHKTLKGYEASQEIVANGSYIMHRSFEPILTYRNSLEISNNFEREKRGLPRIEEEGVEDEHLHLVEVDFGRIDYETIISTRADEIAIGSGKLLKQWTENGRNYYHYKTENKILPVMAYFSAKYATIKEEFMGISLEQYYHEGHEYNLKDISESTKEALKYCIENFGDYPFDHLRMAEIPGHWSFGGFAHPGVISMVEDRLYLVDTREDEDFNLVAKRVVHEVSHQWWGHTLIPKMVEGGSVFIEGFAKYTEAVILEKMYGKSAIWQLSQNANSRYFRGRAYASTPEPPLYIVDGQSYISYGKNYTIMLALRDLLGEEKLNSVLRSITDRHRNEDVFEANTLEFINDLYHLTPTEQHVLIDDWFKRVITYDLSVEDTNYKQLEGGKYEINLNLQSKRFETQVDGSLKEIQINEPIAVGLFSKHPSSANEENGILYLESHQINKKRMKISLIVDELPKYIAIDPYGTRCDEDFVDNLVLLEK
ncbi:hypothetical protein L3049_20885 [Labilibaculum sp. DW002]|uniref:Peptidase M1 membrane alanine aminopeptidase domain-containing protein n=1 Tax=Paralabilibaculum antarcticum TaxID=2912572 RepID=A0ABT5VYH0_9BACT|nr:M1 family aminopeptidase [Labilibaculum sp. DW002]MDE5420454.1 hypothetical protein [Labilibaculum sp. DW002]